MGVERLQQELGLAVRWVPFPLHPETPPEGRSLDNLFAGTGVDLDAMLERMHATARGLGLPVGDRRHTYNSRLAQELAEWAEHRGRGEVFRRGVYRAYFADGANLARGEVLTDIAAAAGLPAEEASKVLTDRTYAAAVDAHWQRAATLGIRAVPAHRFRGAIAVGYHPYPELRRFLIANGAGTAASHQQDQNLLFDRINGIYRMEGPGQERGPVAGFRFSILLSCQKNSLCLSAFTAPPALTTPSPPGAPSRGWPRGSRGSGG